MTDPTKKPQKDQILEHMEKFGSITPLEAQRLYGCMRLGPRCEVSAGGVKTVCYKIAQTQTN